MWGKYCFLQVSHKRKIDCQIDHQGSCTLVYLLNQIWADLTESNYLISIGPASFSASPSSPRTARTSSIPNSKAVPGPLLVTRFPSRTMQLGLQSRCNLKDKNNQILDPQTCNSSSSFAWRTQKSYHIHLKYTELMIMFILSLSFQIENIINFFEDRKKNCHCLPRVKLLNSLFKAFLCIH